MGPMYRYLFVALAITGASCTSMQFADRLKGGDSGAATDAIALEGDSESVRYDSRDGDVKMIAWRAARPQVETRILELVNRERESAGVKPLYYSASLASAANRHSAAMAQDGFFEHRGENEPKLFDRVTASGMDTDHVGENIFETNEWVSGEVADECVQMWMQSEGHRLNMLSPEFEKTGIAVGVSEQGENYITEDFAH
jgi:uncharacterized protein YkwD